jgi:hypothetical protein
MSDSPVSRRRYWLGALLAGALAALFFATCERREVELPRGYVGEAARNRYFAAQKLLTRMGMPAESFSDVQVLASLPAESSTIVLPTARRAVDPATSERLLDWVTRGGHLVVVTWELWDDPNRNADPILDAVGVHQFFNGADANTDGGDEPETEPAPDDQPAPEAEPEPPGEEETPEAEPDEAPDWAEAEFPDRETPLQVRFDSRFRFDLTDQALESLVLEIGDDAGSHWVTIRRGKGLVTALTDDSFMTQPAIGELDHAELVYRMSRLGGHRGPVWFVYGDRHPSMWGLAARYGWMVGASALALLVLWLWSASRRFGPIAPDPVEARRELMEHVRAAGRLQWRRGGAAALLAAVRDSLLARMRDRHPGFQSLTPAEQAERLESVSGLPRERIQDALAFGAEPDTGRFTAKVAILEKLRRSL